jgi:FlaA1/EpsC-like NDP-sugar epimerase
MKIIEKNNWWLILADAVLLNVALWLSFWLRFGGTIPVFYRAAYWQIALFIVTMRLLLLLASGAYRGVWRYIGISDLVSVFKAITWGSVLIAACSFLAKRVEGVSAGLRLEWLSGYPLRVIVGEWLVGLILVGGLRAGLRLFKQYRTTVKFRHLDRKRVLIVGAGDAGEMVARQLMAHPEYGYLPVAFADDDPAKQNRRIHGLPILGGRDDMNAIIEGRDIEEMIIAIPSAPGEVVREVVEHCKRTNIKFKIVPGIKDIIEGEVNINQIREVELEDLLRRPTVNLNLEEISGYLANRTVLITGAGGSIGSELCRQVASFGPKLLLLLGRGENSLYEIAQELAQQHRDTSFEVLVGDIGDRVRMKQVLGDFQPKVVFHAAAHKHVPLMESNPGESVKNNVFGTRSIAEASLAAGVERFVMISTDKAVNPTSVMGATKRIAEDIVKSLNGAGRTKFITVRFGNVLGSRGSVVPLFKKQIAAGGPLTITHPEVERYFMTIPEAVQLVIQAGAMGQGGEVFVLDMGKPIKIVDLAKDLIKLSGREPDRDIRIEFIGLRPGEKLYEELLTAEEGVNTTRNAQIYMAKARTFKARDFDKFLDQLEAAAAKGQHEKIVQALKQWLPSYTPSEL